MNDSKVSVGIGKVNIHLQSAQNRLLIKGGHIVNDDDEFDADVYIEDGVIKQVGVNIMTPGGVRVIDARGKMVIPGGIDTHTHLQMPFMGSFSIDDFYTGTKAALAGGTTMIIDFVAVSRNASLLEAYDKYRSWADPKVCCDYGLHVIVPHWNDKTEKELTTLVKEKGVNSFKFFFAYKGVFMLEDDEAMILCEASKKLGALVMVHAENGKVIHRKAEQLLAKGVTGPEGHMMSRPEPLEIEATMRALTIANETNCPIYVVHVMSAKAGELISAARSRGQICFGEPIAAGLACDNRQYSHTCWRHASAHVMSPPLRDEGTPERLMRMLASGELSCTGTDHCVFKTEQKAAGTSDFRLTPNGVNGIEERMSVIWEKGVETGILSPSQFVAVTSTNAAKIFNVYPKKGRVAVGSDADIVIWNPKETRTISAKTHHSNVDFNIFEGQTVHGVPEFVIAGGRVVVDERELKVTQGAGRFVPMAPFAKHVYSRIPTIDKLRDLATRAVDRSKKAWDAPYETLAPVITETYVPPKQEPEVAAPQRSASPPIHNKGDAHQNGNGTSHHQEETFHAHAHPTKTGVRNMQDSTFSLSGAQADDDRPVRSSTRTFHPPGGTSTGIW